MKISTLASAAIALMFSGGFAVADQPSPIAWTIVEAAEKGFVDEGITPGGDARVRIKYSPWAAEERKPMFVLFDTCGEDPKVVGRPIANLEDVLRERGKPEYFEWQDPGPRWRVCASTGFGRLLLPGDAVEVDLEVDFLRAVEEGLHTKIRPKVYLVDSKELDLLMQLDEREQTQLFRQRNPDAMGVISLFYSLDGRSWVLGDFASVFGIPSEIKRARTGDYEESADRLPVDVYNYRLERKIPASLRDDKGRRMRATLRRAKRQGSGLAGDRICYVEDYDQGDQDKGFALASADAAPAATVLTISGRFSTKWSADHTLHPGWGFKVEAYGTTAFGYRKLGWAWVQSNGTWEIDVDSSQLYVGGTLRVFYRSYNSYYRPMDQGESTYSWVDPTWTGVPAAGSYDVGHRYADTDGGQYNGVGELVDAAMTMWSRLYWIGGINPVASDPIKFYYPNTWFDCGSGSGNPWSCATFNGDKIWLIAGHGTSADVVAHEMAHALNAKYWSKKWPAGAGGSHSLGGCYPSRLGMALSEGFANFMAAWVGYPNRNGAEGSFGSGRWALGFDPEQRTGWPNCSDGWENEVWVARTFWDLHDTRADGDDILWFVNKGAVPSIYLSNGVANDGDARDMRDYENVYRGAASSGHQGFITDIFEQNRM